MQKAGLKIRNTDALPEGAVNLYDKPFQAWDAGAPWIKATSYLAATDGFVVGYYTGSSMAIANLFGKTDSANPPTIYRYKSSVQSTSHTMTAGICMPVKKGEYWLIECVGTPTIFWIPIGT